MAAISGSCSNKILLKLYILTQRVKCVLVSSGNYTHVEILTGNS